MRQANSNTSRTGIVTLRTAVAVVTTAVSIVLLLWPGGSVASVHPSFDPEVHVQLNPGGIFVTWVSSDEEDGFVQWATSSAALAGSPNTATDSRGPLADRLNKRTHHVVVEGVPLGSTLHYNLVSGGVADGPFEATLPSNPLVFPGKAIRGKVTYADGSDGRECLVYVRVAQLIIGTTFERSLWVNGITDGGAYVIDLQNIRQDPGNTFIKDFNNPLGYDASSQNATIDVTVRCDPTQEETFSVTTADAQRDPLDATIYVVDVIVTPPPPPLSISDAAVFEREGNARLTISMDATSTATTTVTYSTADGTAVAGLDYTPTTATATIPPGATSAIVSVPILDDTLEEPHETFTVTLSDPTNATISSTAGSATVTIVNDDGPTAIPGLTPWGLLALGGIMAVALLWARRRLPSRRSAV